MNRYGLSLAIAVVSGAAATSAALAQGTPASTAGAMDMSAVPAASITWTDANIPGFASGMKMAVINGNPDTPGALYTLRLSFPNGYRFPPHWHPMAENLTVLSGTLLLAMGEQADESKLKTYSAGDYLYVAGSKPHFGGARGATVIQLHGQGPFAINLVGGASK
jgi:quercetin dioxygenase-like cupin family protein